MINKYAAYNVWANNRILKFAAGLNQEQLDIEIVSSFKTVRKTLYHIYDAEQIWYERIKQVKQIDWPPSKHFASDISLLELIKSSENLQYLVNDLGLEGLKSKTHYKDLKGNEFETSNTDIFHHVFNHSTFHRGQVITMLRQLEATEIPSTDFIAYVRQSTQEK
jgi:uncharacterized damage-inducible protein DinB